MQESSPAILCHGLLRSALGLRALREVRDGRAGAGEALAEGLHVANVLVPEHMRGLVAGDLHGVGLVHAAARRFVAAVLRVWWKMTSLF